MSAKTWSIFLFLILMGISFVVIYKLTGKKENELKKNFVITQGKIIDIDAVLRGDGLWIRYEYLNGHEVIEDKKRIFVESKYKDNLRKLLVSHYLPVIYNRTDTHNNLMLITDKEYNKFEVSKPDSIQNILRVLDSLSFGK